jgi:hypothetical protein
MKRQIAPLLFLLVLCTACGSPPEANVEPVPITVGEAVERGFPIYLPSNDILKSMGITTLPTTTLNSQGTNCVYLSIDFLYKNKPPDQNDEKPAMKMLVSDGCAYPAWQGYEIELSWAVEGKATRVGEDFVDELPPIILFEEPTRQFQYVVFSEEPFDNTMKLLESMHLLFAQ